MQKNTIFTIQALRGIAASLVVFFHSYHYMSERNYIPQSELVGSIGRSGVDLFFVISGFIMVYISWDNFQKPGATLDFFIRRLIRIAPIYWIYSSLMALIMFFLPQYFSHGKEFGVTHTIASLLFIPWGNNMGDIVPTLPVGWTLNYEMYFYLVFSFALLFNREKFLLILAIALLGGVVAGMSFETHTMPLYWDLATSPILLEFVMGCLIGTWYKNNSRIEKSQSASLIIFGFILFIFGLAFTNDEVNRVIVRGVPMSLILTGFIFLERQGFAKTPPHLITLGNISYSIYLSHLFTIHLTGLIWVKLVGSNYFAYPVIALVPSILIGYFSYIYIERPITKKLTSIHEGIKIAA